MNLFEIINANSVPNIINKVSLEQINNWMNDANSRALPRMRSGTLSIERFQVATLLGFAGNYCDMLNARDYDAFKAITNRAMEDLVNKAKQSESSKKLIQAIKARGYE